MMKRMLMMMIMMIMMVMTEFLEIMLHQIGSLLVHTKDTHHWVFIKRIRNR